jgi:hypothetical protein
MNRLDPEKRAQVVKALVEGNSIRAVARMTGIERGTITNLLVNLGHACAEFQDKTLQNLSCKRIQCDEIWAYCYAKDKNLPVEKHNQFGFGSVWTWTAIDADTKLIASWMVGPRGANAADGNAPVHPVDQRLFEEDRQPHCRRLSPFHALQFRPHPPDPPCYASHGSGDRRSTLGSLGHN